MLLTRFRSEAQAASGVSREGVVPAPVWNHAVVDICGTNYDVEDPGAFRRQLVGVSMNGPRAEAEAACMVALDHDDPSVRRVGLTSIGHSARVHRTVSDALISRAIAALDDPDLAEWAINALDDVAMFVYDDRRGWEAVPGVGAR